MIRDKQRCGGNHPPEADAGRVHITKPTESQGRARDDMDPLTSRMPSRVFLKFAIAMLLLGAAGAVVALRVVVPDQDIRTIGPAMVALVALTGWFLLSLGRLRESVQVLAYGSWLAASVIAVFTNGVRSPVIVIYPVLILLIGWLLNTSMAVLIAALSVVVTLGLVWLELNGLLPGALPVPPLMYGVDQMLVYLCSAALIVVLVRTYQDRLQDLSRITEALSRRTTEMEVSKAELNKAQAVSKVGSWIYDVPVDAMRMSAEMARILGVPQGLVGSYEAYMLKVYPEDRVKVKGAWQKALDSGVFFHEHRIQVKGQMRWVRHRAELSYTAHGTVLRAEGTAQEVTDLKLAELALRDSESRYRTLVELAPQPILVHRMGVLLYVNAAAIKLFGAENPQELLSKRTFELVHPDYREAQTARMKKIIEVGATPAMIESRFLRLDGTPIEVEVQGTPIVYDGAPAIQVAIHDITQIKAYQLQLEHTAHFDALTGLPNRVLLADRLHQGLLQAERRGVLLAVVYLDLDGFKAVNDHHGHEVGDQLLVALARRMRLALRDGDTLARMGGDEFVAVLADLSEVAASEPLITRLLAAAAEPIQVGAITVQVSASLGLTFFPQAESVNADLLLRQADQAMYQAKLAGKNRYHLFDAEQDRSVRGLHEDLARIRLALLQHELVLHYQPTVNMRSGEVVGVEALIRWQHPDDGLLLPARFLPLIDDHPLAIAVGEWMIDTALGQMEAWRDQGLSMPVSMNVGARQLQHPDFPKRLGELLRAHPGVRPEQVQLEVLETSALADLAHVASIMDQCRELGVSFALDDFGTGYSSLTYLKRLPVTHIKVDQSFVRDMLEDPDDLLILEGVISLARAFHRTVMAEGVETEAHGRLLLRLGCELAQGFGIAKPLTADELPGWVATWVPHPSWGARLALLQAESD